MDGESVFALVIIALFVAVGVGGCAGGKRYQETQMQREAIAHHAAEWRIDANTGKKQFTWLTDSAEHPKQ